MKPSSKEKTNKKHSKKHTQTNKQKQTVTTPKQKY